MTPRWTTRFFLFCVTLASAPIALADWPNYRGPTSDGVAPPSEIAPPIEWSETENVAWKTPLPYSGWSTPVIADGRVWLTTATEGGKDFFVLCIDAESGEVLLDKPLFHCDEPEPLGNGMNGYASPSAVVETGRAYVHFGSYGTACLDSSSGDVLWTRDDLPCRHFRGPGSSLLLHGDLLVLTMDGIDLQYLVALNKRTGETVWKTDRTADWNDLGPDGLPYEGGDLRKAYSTPIVAAARGGEQLISVGAKAAYGYDPATGEELWKVAHESQGAAPRPLYADGTAYLCTGFGKTELLAINTAGRGDVSETHVAWRSIRGIPNLPSPILADGRIYLLNDRGVLSCVSIDDGEEVWRQRLPGEYVSSPILIGDLIYCCNNEGTTAVVRIGEEPEIVAENRLDDGFMASPATSDGALFLRTKTHLYRIAKPPAPASSASN